MAGALMCGVRARAAGLPVSTTQVLCGAIFAVGLFEGGKGLNWRVALKVGPLARNARRSQIELCSFSALSGRALCGAVRRWRSHSKVAAQLAAATSYQVGLLASDFAPLRMSITLRPAYVGLEWLLALC